MSDHKRNCPEGRARRCTTAIECPHGFDVCPQCDPCTCDEIQKKLHVVIDEACKKLGM